eukprot:1171626-Pyramimonas_sp.AAC.1
MLRGRSRGVLFPWVVLRHVKESRRAGPLGRALARTFWDARRKESRRAGPLGRAPARTLWDAQWNESKRVGPLGRAPARTLWDARRK